MKLAYYKNEREYQCLHILCLGEIHTVTAVSLKRHTNTFGIVTPTRTFYIQASSQKECDDWVDSLNEARNRLKEIETPPAPTPVAGTPRGSVIDGCLTRSLSTRRAGVPPAITTTRYDGVSQQSGAPVTPTSPIAGLNFSGVSSDSDDPFTSAAGSPPRTNITVEPPQTPTTTNANTNTNQHVLLSSPQRQSNNNQVVLSGYLMKCGSKRKTAWRKRWFTLTADRLTYAKSHMDTKHVKQVPLVKIVDAIECAPSSTSGSHGNNNHGQGDDGDDGGGTAKPGSKHTFKIITTERGAFLLCAPSEEEEIRWLSAVRALIARRRSMEGRP